MKYASLFARLLANSSDEQDRYYKGTPCWCWTGTSMCRRRWHGRINIRTNGRHITVQAHRLMAELVLGRKLDPEFETIDHACEFGACINPWHFRIATRVENSVDMQRRRHGGLRIVMKTMLDPTLWTADPFTREMPVLKSAPRVVEECPF